MCKSSRNDDAEDRTRNSAIKLFGKTILVQFSDEDGSGSAEDRGSSSTAEEFVRSETAGLKRPPPDVLQQNRQVKCSTVENFADKRKSCLPPERSDGEKLEKSQAKPEKIVACPRCQSLNTKFCYFNNYNVNQPRHFCKNCRRYWTDGGTMRNIPVGAGRRKSKNFTALNQHLQLQKLKDEDLIIAGDPFKNETKNAVESTCGSSVITAAAASEIRKDACFEEIDGATSFAFACGFPAFGSTSLDSGNPIIINAPNDLITAESSAWISNSVRIDNPSEVTRSIPVLESLGLCTSRAFPACVPKNDVK